MAGEYVETGTEGNDWVVNDPARQWWRWENETRLHEVNGSREFLSFQDAVNAVGPIYVHIRRATSSTAAGTGSGAGTGTGTTGGGGSTTTTPATTDGITGLPLIGPFIGSLSNSTGLPPIAIAAGAALAIAWALGMFEGGGRRR